MALLTRYGIFPAKAQQIICFLAFWSGVELIHSQNLVDSINAVIMDPSWDDSTKVVNIYDWTGRHIRYARSSYSRTDNTTWQSAEIVLKTGKAVCIGYANVFAALCEKSGIQAFVVEGFSNDSYQTQHAWNVIRLNGNWYSLDVTWDADRIYNGLPWEYFLTGPEIFNQSHYPHDPVWQLTDQPLTFIDFQSNSKETVAPLPFSYRDTLANWLQLNERERLIQSLLRSMSFNPENVYVLKDLANYYFEKAMSTYHQIVPGPVTEDPVNLQNEHLARVRTFFTLAKELFEKVITIEKAGGMTDSKINLMMIEDNLKSLD